MMKVKAYSGIIFYRLENTKESIVFIIIPATPKFNEIQNNNNRIQVQGIRSIHRPSLPQLLILDEITTF